MKNSEKAEPVPRLKRNLSLTSGIASSPTAPTSLDLEWDRHRDFSLMPESDTMSSYDLSERMAELFKYKFLDFEIASNAGSMHHSSENLLTSPQSAHLPGKQRTNSASSLFSASSLSFFSDVQSMAFTPMDAITIEDLFSMTHSSHAFAKREVTWHRSEPNLSRVPVLRKYLSLPNIHINTEKKARKSKPSVISVTSSESSVNFSRMGRMEKLRSFLRKFKQLFLSAFSFSGQTEDEFRTSYSAATNKLVYKFSSANASPVKRLYPIDEETTDS